MTHSGVALIDPHPIYEKIDLSAGKRVADLGCGRTGHFIFSSSRVVGDTGIVYAVDIIKEILEGIEARKKAEGFDNIQTIWSDIEKYGKIPIPEKSLDVVFFVNVLFLLVNKSEAFKEAARLLKEGGFLVVVDWIKKIGPLGPDEKLLVPEEKIAELGNNIGLKLVDKTMANGYHYVVIFKKE